MAQTVLTRQMLTQYSTGITGGGVPAGLVIAAVPDFIDKIKRSDVPMLSVIPKKGSVNQVIIPYGEGDLSPTEDLIAEALDDSETAITVDNGEYFQIWDMVKIDDEVCLVTDISGDDLTVTRAWGASVAATHLDNAPIYILGPAVPEGVDAPRSPVTRGEVFSTVPQIMEYTFPISHRADVTPNYQNRSGSNFKYELKRKMEEAATDLDNIALDGIYNLGDGSGLTGDNPSTTRGLREATTAHVTDLNGAALTFRDFMEAAQDVASEVGEKDMATKVMGSYFTKRLWNSWFQPSRHSTMSEGRARTDWDSVDTDLGVFTFMINHKMRDNEIIVWRPEDSALKHYEGGNWATGEYFTQGWHKVGFLRGDFAFIFEGDRRRFRIHDFSTTVADYPYLDVPA
jgi:hypothetical protein